MLQSKNERCYHKDHYGNCCAVDLWLRNPSSLRIGYPGSDLSVLLQKDNNNNTHFCLCLFPHQINGFSYMYRWGLA